MRNFLLEVFNLFKFFGGLRALNGVNLGVERNRITLIIGPNGSGKTTLINVISGFYRADRGKIVFEGKEITNKPPHEIYRLGIVRTFQIPQPLKKLTVLENLLIASYNPGENLTKTFGKFWEKTEEELVEKAFKILEFLEIDHLWDNEAYKLSGGQLRLLEIGRALMSDAKLVIMDEPIAGVAPFLAYNILEKFRQLTGIGVTFLIIEHRLDIILKFVDYIYVMSSGRVIAEGKEREILNNPEVVEVYLGASY